ncbi:MAG: recombinase family protein [Solirubrobacterales bacterium]
MGRSAVAYIGAADHADELGLQTGLDVVAVVHEAVDSRPEALVKVLERIVGGDATALVVARLGLLARSLRDLVALLDWLEVAHADLVAMDVGLDTGTSAGRRTVRLLREIERWEREPEAGRPARGRPGLATHAPELGERITVMRAEGLSLQAIADALNDDDVPTPRGGERWRPSSVQAALGYRRPRPPAPGAPPPPPRHPPRPARHRQRPKPPRGPAAGP